MDIIDIVDTMENGVGSAAKELDSQFSQLSSQMWVTFQSILSIHLDLARWMAANIELALDTSDRWYREVSWILIKGENVWTCHTLWSVLSSRWALPQLFLPGLCELPARPRIGHALLCSRASVLLDMLLGFPSWSWISVLCWSSGRAKMNHDGMSWLLWEGPSEWLGSFKCLSCSVLEFLISDHDLSRQGSQTNSPRVCAVVCCAQQTNGQDMAHQRHQRLLGLSTMGWSMLIYATKEWQVIQNNSNKPLDLRMPAPCSPFSQQPWSVTTQSGFVWPFFRDQLAEPEPLPSPWGRSRRQGSGTVANP